VSASWAVDERVAPPASQANGDRAAVDAGYAMWQRAVERSRSWATDEA